MIWQQVAWIAVAFVSMGMAYWLGIQHGRRVELRDTYRYAASERYAGSLSVANFVVMLLEEKHRHG